MGALAALVEKTGKPIAKAGTTKKSSALATLAAEPVRKAPKLSPEMEAEAAKHPFNPLSPGNKEFNRQLDQRSAPTTVKGNFHSSLGDALKFAGKSALELPQGMIHMYTQPSEGVKQIESAGNVNKLPVGLRQLAQAATDLEAARLMVYNAARLRDAGVEYTQEAAMAKLFSSQVAERVTSTCVDLFGGYGFTKEYPVEKFWRDSKIGAIYEGTSNMQLQTIAKLLLR